VTTSRLSNIKEIASLFEYKTPTKKLEQVMFNDLEKDGVEVNYVHGYPSLAAIIASDSGAAIYRRFDRLSARTLLYMQSELSELESELETLERADLHNLEDGANEPHRDWNLFKAKAEDPDNEKWRQRMALVKEIQEKLKIYRGYTIRVFLSVSTRHPTDPLLTSRRSLSAQLHAALCQTTFEASPQSAIQYISQ
jgi:hypothetical protein